MVLPHRPRESWGAAEHQALGSEDFHPGTATTGAEDSLGNVVPEDDHLDKAILVAGEEDSLGNVQEEALGGGPKGLQLQDSSLRELKGGGPELA